MRRWLKSSKQADGALFLVMMIVFAIVLLALLVWVMLAHPARAAQLVAAGYEACLLREAQRGL
jgi:hypothetical protein